MPDSVVPNPDSELRDRVERALGAHYELDCEIGRGGMGIVYRARDRRLKRVVAIKVLPPELAFRSEIKTRFLREAETSAQLNHPNIVDIYSVDEAEGLVYFVMAYIDGDNLAKRVHDRGPMDIAETRDILHAVADALAYAHERGVIHRDIKPDNILLDVGSGRPLVTDFGIARAITEGDSRLTATGMAIGTPTYMSPEQAAGDRQVDGRSDLYALGVVAYQMLTGQPPFTASSTPAILVKHLSEQPTPVHHRRQDVPDDLSRIVMMLLEKDPDARLPSATALMSALDGDGYLPPPSRSPAAGMSAPRASAPAGAYPARPASGRTVGSASGFGVEVQFGRLDVENATPDELQRWEAPEVVRFRRKMAPYLFVNGVIILAAIFTGLDLVVLTVLSSIYMAFKYAKLWSDGYDWRDVFRQPRDRDLIDVAEDTATYMKAVLDKDERARRREERRVLHSARRTSGGARLPAAAPSPARPRDEVGAYGPQLRTAMSHRDEILRILDRMSPSDRARVPEVGRSASALADRVRSLALSLAELDRTNAPDASARVESEIVRLEEAANPLEAASDERVRRLAHLKRQRRALADVTGRRAALVGKLETCLSSLESMKYDVLRLTTGSQNHHQVTNLAMEALHLADSVDSALMIADEMQRAGGSQSAARPTA